MSRTDRLMRLMDTLRRLPAPVLRWGIVATGLVMAAVFFRRQ